MKKILIGSFIITVGVLTAGLVSYAWNEPINTPPNGNVGGISSFLQNGVIHAKDFVIDYMNSSGATTTKSLTLYIDKDSDGYTPAQGDSNDNDASVHPGAAPQYNSGKDADCNGVPEYTVDVTQNVNTWNVDSACTRGGHAANMIAYITDSTGWAKLNNHTVTTNSDGSINNLSLIRGFDWGNKYSKRLICLSNDSPKISTSPVCLSYDVANRQCAVYAKPIQYDHSLYQHIYAGNSGNLGSCGGHGEMDYDYYNLPKYTDSNPTANTAKLNQLQQYGFWHIWCN